MNWFGTLALEHGHHSRARHGQRTKRGDCVMDDAAGLTCDGDGIVLAVALGAREEIFRPSSRKQNNVDRLLIDELAWIGLLPARKTDTDPS